MPADAREIKDAIEEGIKIIPLVAPVRFIGEKGKVKEIECVKMELKNLIPAAEENRKPSHGFGICH